jgi:hypothetical protein
VERLSIQCVNAFFDAHEDGSDVLAVKGRSSAKQNIENDPTSPIIHLFAVFSIDDLRSKIHGCPLRLILELFLFKYFRNPEIDQLYALDVVLLFQKDVLRL